MLNTMRSLALLDLNRLFGAQDRPLSELRQNHVTDLAPLLVEAANKIAKVYLLQADPTDPNVIMMWGEDLTEDKAKLLPFNRPSGSQSAAIGPVFKRSWTPNKMPRYGPSDKILSTTDAAFTDLSEGDTQWADYFKEVRRILFEPALVKFGDQEYTTGADGQYADPMAAVIALIPETKTAFVTVIDHKGRWPGQVPEYQDYLARTLAAIKYTTGTAPAQERCYCPLCGRGPTTVYPNALRGAGINFANMDREGAFPGLDSSRAWQGYALCLDCADLLYIFKFHLRERFQGHVAGASALLLPALLGNPAGRRRFMKDWHDYIHGLTGAKIEDIEENLMEFFAGRDDAQLVLHILWAKFGQHIDDCRGLVTDILPSRLQQISRWNRAANAWRHPLAPKVRIEEAQFSLAMNFLFPLFKRPGGKPAEAANASPQLFAIKRQLAERLYHGAPLRDPTPFQEALLETARWYLKQAADEGKPWGLIGEGREKRTSLTGPWLAGYVTWLASIII